MTIKSILKGSDPTLKEKSELVNFDLDKDLLQLEQDLHETLKSCPNGIAISAPQIGVLKRVFAIKKSIAKGMNIHWTIVNPRWSPRSQPKQAPEGCLSFQGLTLNKIRYPLISVTYYTIEGKEIKKTITNSLIAQIFQHEIEHFQGVLLID